MSDTVGSFEVVERNYKPTDVKTTVVQYLWDLPDPNYTGHVQCYNDLNGRENFQSYDAWYKDGKLHREHGPAMIFYDGRRIWYQNGKPYRKDGRPNCEWPDGTMLWLDDDGKQHRENGPAEIGPQNGTSYWLHNKWCKRETYFKKLAKAPYNKTPEEIEAIKEQFPERTGRHYFQLKRY